jgi:DNA-binding transcriptional regulator PaaX
MWLAVGGAVAIAATSPYFIVNILRSFQKGNRYNRKDLHNTFYRLRQDGYLVITVKKHQMFIELTEKGRKRAGRFQINDIKIKKPKRWDGKWRIVIFDVAQAHRMKREALRGLLKRFEFYQLQKSVWIYPYHCRDEIDLLQSFFGFTHDELRLIVAEDIGVSTHVRKMFHV